MTPISGGVGGVSRELDLSLLRTFLAVATTGSFTATSQRLYRTQPAISQRIKRLEEMVGAALLTRRVGEVVLTPDGEILMGYAYRLLGLNDEALQRLKVSKSRSMIRLGVAETLAAVGLERVLARFFLDCPNTTVILDFGVDGAVSGWLKEGRCDLALVSGFAGGVGRTIARFPMHWVVGREYQFQADGPIPLVMLPEGCFFRHLALAALADGNGRWDLVLESSRWSGLRSAVQAGVGVSVAGTPMLDEGMLRLELLPELPEVGLNLLSRAGSVPRSLADGIGRLATLLEQEIGGGLAL